MKVASQAPMDIQSSNSASVFKKPFHDASHDDLLDSQCSVSSCFLDFSQSQTVSSSSPVQQAAQQPSKCTLACYFCSCILCQYMFAMHACLSLLLASCMLVTCHPHSAPAEIVLSSLQEVVGIMCPSCKSNKNLMDTLSRALENAEKLINLHPSSPPVTPLKQDLYE